MAGRGVGKKKKKTKKRRRKKQSRGRRNLQTSARSERIVDISASAQLSESCQAARLERAVDGPLLGSRGQKHISLSDSAKLNKSSGAERR